MYLKNDEQKEYIQMNPAQQGNMPKEIMNCPQRQKVHRL